MLEIVDNFQGYRQSQISFERIRLVTNLLTATKYLTYERERTAVALRGAEPISEDDRVSIGEQRRLADAYLDAALEHPDGLSQAVRADILKRRQEIGQLRQQGDQDVSLPPASRGEGLVERWSGTADALIQTIHGVAYRLTGELHGDIYRDIHGDKAKRLMLVATALLHQRIALGSEASLVVQALSAARPPTTEALRAIFEMRGREGRLWQEIDRLGRDINIKSILDAINETKKHHIGVLRPLQDRSLDDLSARRQVFTLPDSLASTSLATLDEISDLNILSTEHAARLADENRRSVLTALFGHFALSAFLISLLALTFRYVLRNVVEPLEKIDAELRRMGALADGNAMGNEIVRLQASVVELERGIAERKQVETARDAALAEAQCLAQMRSAFLSQMSHELRTPLNGILGHAQNLLRDETLRESQSDGLTIIQKSGDHLLGVINNILDHAKIEAKQLEPSIGDIRLDTLLDTVVDILRVRAEEKRLDLVSEPAPDLPVVIRGDEQRLRQVLLNLLANAIKFTDRGRVSLHVSQAETGRMCFSVRDSGIGIPEDQLEAIFEPFRQGEDAGRRAGGTGLGLSISRQLVRMMGGEITVQSREGEGSVFSFELAMEVVNGAPLRLHAASQHTARSHDEPPMAAPDRQELETLLVLTQRGNMRSVRQHATRLVELDERYRPFAERLKELAGAYQSRELLGFVEACLDLALQP